MRFGSSSTLFATVLAAVSSSTVSATVANLQSSVAEIKNKGEGTKNNEKSAPGNKITHPEGTGGAPVKKQILNSQTRPKTACLPGQSELIVEVLTDPYASENRWELTSGGEVVDENPLLESSVLYVDNVCLDNGDYTWTLYDTFGDGLCYSFGTICEGYHQLFLDGVSIGFGDDNFGAQVSYEFIVENNVEPLPCGDDEYDLLVSVTTDSYPTESNWVLERFLGDDLWETVAENDLDIANTMIDQTVCLGRDAKYRWILADSFGDGLCVGSPPSSCGSFSVSLDETVFFEGFQDFGADFGTEALVEFTIGNEFPVECGDDQYELFLNVETDPYSTSENEWLLERQVGIELWEPVAENDLVLANWPYPITVCVDSGTTHRWTLTDTYGDGLCVGDPPINCGLYEVILDDEVLASGADFDNEVIVSFTTEGSPPPVDCGSYPELVIAVSTDNYAQENQWVLEQGIGNFQWETVQENALELTQWNYTDTICLDGEGTYRWTLFDTYGDGLCVGGLNCGSYSLTLDGTEIASGDDFDFNVIVAFTAGDCVDSMYEIEIEKPSGGTAVADCGAIGGFLPSRPNKATLICGLSIVGGGSVSEFCPTACGPYGIGNCV